MQENKTRRKTSIDAARCIDSPLPAPASNVGELPTSLTFFLSTDERRRVLHKLKRFKGDRRTALLSALRLDPCEGATRQGGRHG